MLVSRLIEELLEAQTKGKQKLESKCIRESMREREQKEPEWSKNEIERVDKNKKIDRQRERERERE